MTETEFKNRRRRLVRIAWWLWCGFWALSWLAYAVQALIDYAQYGIAGAEFDMVIGFVLFAGSVALMWSPVGKRRTA